MKPHKSILILITFILIFSACKNKEKISINIFRVNNASELYKKVEKNSLDYQTISIKTDIQFRDKNNDIGFTGMIRAKKDSIIWISAIALLGIEAARLQITPDSVFFINRLQRSYFEGGYNFFKEKFGLELNFAFFQAILSNKIFVYPYNQKNISLLKKYQFKKDSTNYFLLKPKALFEPEKPIAQLIQTNADYRLLKNTIQVPAGNNVEINYLDYKKFNKQVYPEKIIIQLRKPKQKFVFYADIKKISINDSERFPFRIPSRYKPMQFE